jgi:hypothetical protein
MESHQGVCRVLGQSEQEVYVWAYCSLQTGGGSESLPAVIYLKNDGAIQNVKVPRSYLKNGKLALKPKLGASQWILQTSNGQL